MLQTILRPPRTADDIAQGARLAKMQKKDIGPAEVAKVLNTAGLKYVIVGGHAANGYMGRPRSTVDVDVVVESPKKAIAVLAKSFPELTMTDTPVVTRFKNADGDEAIDVMKPIGSKLWKRLLQIAIDVEVDGVQLRIPTVEGILAAKLAAMASPARQLLDKQQDGLDFARIVTVNATLDLRILEELGELVYPGGGAEILKLIADVRAGRLLQF